MTVVVSKENSERYHRDGWWDDRTLISIFLEGARKNPERTAIADPLNKEDLTGMKPERVTYGRLKVEVDRLATFFKENGIGKDSVVVVQLPNIYELLATYLSAWRVGAAISPVPMQWRTHELSTVLRTTGATAFISTEFRGFSHTDMVKGIAKDFPALKNVFSLKHIKDALEGGKVSDELDGLTNALSGDDISVIQWTSGTEKEPKACPMSHNNWGYLRYFYRNEYKGGILKDGDVIMNPAPLVNMTGIAVGVVPWLMVSGTFVLHHPFDPLLYFKQLIGEKVNFTLGVPAVVVAMLKHPDVDKFDLKAVRLFAQGSAPPPPWTFEEFKKRWGIESLNVWGQNEGTGLFSTPFVIEDLKERARSFPWPNRDVETDIPFFRGIESKLVDIETGKEVTERGKVGELCFRSPMTIPQYYNQPELTKHAFDPDGFFHTGDLFMVVDSTKIAFFDRAKDIIIRGGFNISSAEIEDIIKKDGRVLDVAAIAVPDKRLGERVCVCVVSKDGSPLTLDDITGIMKENDVAKYKWPEKVMMVESIPRNPVGKAKKDILRKELNSKTG